MFFVVSYSFYIVLLTFAFIIFFLIFFVNYLKIDQKLIETVIKNESIWKNDLKIDKNGIPNKVIKMKIKITIVK